MEYLHRSPDSRQHRDTTRLTKRGSSLALVMILSSVLILLGTALLPLMVTSGSTSAQMLADYDNYLLSRSAIEYAKSELAYIARTEPPCTFAVIKDGSGFRAIRKLEGGISLNSEYSSRVDFDPLGHTDDTQDRPRDSSAGEDVVAICAAVPADASGRTFQITISSFIRAQVGVTCRAEITFEPSGGGAR